MPRVMPPLAMVFVAAAGAFARAAEAQRLGSAALDWSVPSVGESGAVGEGDQPVAGDGTIWLLPRVALGERDVNRVARGDTTSTLRVRTTAGAERRRARWAPLASAALPGAGQAVLAQQRFLPYLAVEGYAWLQILADRHEGRRQRNAYRSIARTVARARFSATAPAGDWEYYERMEHFSESGAYDLNPGGALDPEPDTTTYNGSVWLLARQTYWEDPFAPPPAGSAPYESALSFYRQRAVTSEYQWSWRNAELEQDVFRRTIARSNDAYRRAAQDLAVLIANHVLSTVDAYVTVRLRGRRTASGRLPAAGGGGDGYGVSVEVPLPRATTAAGR